MVKPFVVVKPSLMVYIDCTINSLANHRAAVDGKGNVIPHDKVVFVSLPPRHIISSVARLLVTSET
jgi:hypothetical protein